MPITATNGKEKIVNNDINTINQSLGNTYNTIQTNETELDEIAFFNKNIGALICNDIGNKAYQKLDKISLYLSQISLVF